MDGIKQQIQARQMEALENKHVYNTRKIKREMRAELDKLTETSKAAIADIKKDYNKKFQEEQQNLEVQLIGLRKKNSNVIRDENKRYEKLVEELKLTHAEKMTEMKISQEREMEQQKTAHTDYLDNQRAKFEAEKARLES